MIRMALHKRGFTLIEILIAILILGIVITTIYGAYTGTLRVIRAADSDGVAYRMARVVTDRMIRDFSAMVPIGGAFVFSARHSPESADPFLSIKFLSAAHLDFGAQGVAPAGTSISYTILESSESSSEYTLWRTDVPLGLENLSTTLLQGDETVKTGGLILCKGIKTLDYKFYDSNGNVYQEWDSTAPSGVQKGSVPSRIDIVLGLVRPDNPDHPYTFTTSIYLPVSQVNSGT
jgi:prepilin-type N-terminal cleavage/methylation domain-containing protein